MRTIDPFAAFAGQQTNEAGQISGNAALTASGSLAGISSGQGTTAASVVKGNGAVIGGAISGNHTEMNSNGSARAGQGYAKTQTQATQTNIGGTITGGLAQRNNGSGNTASGTAGGSQNGRATGGSAAVAADLGGFVRGNQQNNHPSRH